MPSPSSAKFTPHKEFGSCGRFHSQSLWYCQGAIPCEATLLSHLVPCQTLSSSSPLSKLAHTPPSVPAAISGAPRMTYAPPPSAGIRCSARCCPWMILVKPLRSAVGTQHHRQPCRRTPRTPRTRRTRLSPRCRAQKGPLAIWS